MKKTLSAMALVLFSLTIAHAETLSDDAFIRLVETGSPIASSLLSDPQWKSVMSNQTSILLVRK